MKRLREETDSNDPKVAHVARLLADVEPLSESEVRRARVLRAINRGRNAAPSRFRRPIFVALVVACTAATAGATIGFSRWVMTTNRDAPLNQVAPLNQTSARQSDALARQLAPGNADHAREAKFAEETTALHSAEDQDPLSTDSLGAPDTKRLRTEKLEAPGQSSSGARSSSAARSSGAVSSSGVARAPSTPAQESAPSSEAALVQQAVEALRQANDPGRAAALLKEYRQKAPSGALAEEALALSIEVALAQKSDQARSYAERYLKAYAQGRFTTLAQRALR